MFYLELFYCQFLQTLEFPMSEEHMDTFVFAIVKRREEKRLRKSNIDLV